MYIINGRDYVYDKETDFFMDAICYKNGCNCHTCTEGLLGECDLTEDYLTISKMNDEELKQCSNK